MIDGVKIKELVVHKDVPDDEERTGKLGILTEVVRSDEGLLEKFGQSTFTITYPGTIKGFHWHKKQDDLWFVATGRALVVLYDRREGSPTFGETQTLELGEDNYKLLVIPKGVAHGLKVLGDERVLMFYHTTEPYDPDNPDEERVIWNDPGIGFNWDEFK